jgi:ABC-2 type transport system ATP-binding protein
MLCVEVDRVVREFTPRRGSKVVALAGVDLAVSEGEIHGLLGPNGAGKTTLVKILTTILIPTSGEARVLGHDVVKDAAEVRRLIGLVFGGDRGLYTRLTARQNLDYWAALYDVPVSETRDRVEELLSTVGLTERADDRVEGFSRGMKQRLHLARGLVGRPRVLFLDEPTVGLDPMAALEFRNLVIRLRSEGTTILLTTHDLTEAEAVCDRVSMIDRGRILATESPATLGRIISEHEWVEARTEDTGLVDTVTDLVGVDSVENLPGGAVRFRPGSSESVRSVLQMLIDGGVTSIRTGHPSLQDVYMHLMGDRGMQV